ncbi:glycosyltransferase [Pedobacter sandarakinus]|uniref:glycosyltransferase n=1 Tax=Pedobacter sandarakinus TaxID=353156 RepID=UPI002245E093|nr:glycosyltransferase [Pedobacter sandarakinus]MCX2575919.1 glycosyltransferase [Pedobacter sandarakinus]
MLVTVILPTYNPDLERLNATLGSLKNQSLSINDWELIVIDNNSTTAVEADLSWHPNARLVKEPSPGLTNARLKGFRIAQGSIIVMVDDDNIIDESYLTLVLTSFIQNETLGAIGGKSLPKFEIEPPAWLAEFYPCLALRDPGENVLLAGWQNFYPAFAPIGAGMAIRKESLGLYLEKEHHISDRMGNSLSSGGDNDIVLEILKARYQIGYFPNLVLQHIIPKERMTVSYISRLIHDSNCSWVQLLRSHGISPWKKIPIYTVALRSAKAWFKYKAWKGKEYFIRWRGACGTFKGLAK